MQMVIKERVNCDILVQEAEFEVANFAAACALTCSQTKGNGKPACAISSGSILCFQNYKFGIDISFKRRVGDGDQLHRTKNIGIAVSRHDKTSGAPLINVMMWTMNRTPSCTIELGDDEYFEVLDVDEWFGWGVEVGGIDNLPLGDVLDNTKGWLHQGSLKIHAKISCVMGFGRKESPVAPALSMQQDVCDSFKALLETKELADFTLIVEDERIEAHAFILKARSPVFKAMLSSNMREGKDMEVAIEGLEASAVKDLLSFFYTGNVRPEVLEDRRSVLALLQAAHRYQATFLEQACTESLNRHMAVETVSETFEIADVIGCGKLKQACLRFMQSHMADIRTTDAYARLVAHRPSLLDDIINSLVGPPTKKRKAEHCGS
mmetsp:Transcript_111258/g.248653  ORF Transcript_111258/g.248653 Transcript_111258/m.248653 type:complete len:378 (-) Transcript_111258:98-1231(-)